MQVFDGIMRGTITHQVRGDNAYGTDGIFIPDGQLKTWGEMNKEEQIAYSVRRIGLKKLEAILATAESNLNNSSNADKKSSRS